MYSSTSFPVPPSMKNAVLCRLGSWFVPGYREMKSSHSAMIPSEDGEEAEAVPEEEVVGEVGRCEKGSAVGSVTAS